MSQTEANVTKDTLADILIVDDDNTVIMALHKTLSGIGRVRFALNAQQAFSLIDERKPDLILLDVDLPDINGIDICIQLKDNEDTCNIPILFITSKVDLGFEEQVFNVGAADYIAKPLNPRVVAARAEIHLAYHNAMALLNKQASTDGLTGLANRRIFDTQLNTALKNSRRQSEPLTIAMIDIDQFKKYNDHYGHMAGDDCIKAIAHTTDNTVNRPTDLAARYGGEEFALILPNTDATGAESILNELRGAIESLRLPHAPDATYDYVTISAGFSTITPSKSHSLDNLDVLENADKALYQSKENGRNRCTYLPTPLE